MNTSKVNTIIAGDEAVLQLQRVGRHNRERIDESGVCMARVGAVSYVDYTGVLDVVANYRVDSKMSDMDGFPYSTLLYGNGPGYTQPRTVPSNYTSESEERNSVHGSAVPRQWATHGGEDVPVFAQGPLASVLFSGTFDQSYIPHAIAYAACLGEHAQRCSGGSDNYTQQQQQVVHACASPEVSSVSSPGGVVVVASSVMADDSQTAHGSSRRNILDDSNLTFLVVVTCATAVYHLAIT
uniref:alkaline phosphatase n=1 Tax=Timema bartmani TaxID=61472 RepID=A0A7R9EMF3_9NEOP|nr:unnamed protein product [Timema bartmani]